MSTGEPAERTARLRREPPRFRHVVVRDVSWLSARLMRVTLTGPELEGLTVEQPAASVRLLLPSPESAALVVPEWAGNEFLLPDGGRPIIRTFTPRNLDPANLDLDLDIVVHGGGVASEWATSAAAGDAAAISGPGRGYAVDPATPAFVLAGDETAIPAISQLLESLSADAVLDVRIEMAHPDARLELPAHPRAAIEWVELAPGAPPGDALFDAMRSVELAAGARVWVAGEAAAVQRVRRYLFEDRQLPRSHATVRGYWKHGRTGGADDDG